MKPKELNEGMRIVQIQSVETSRIDLSIGVPKLNDPTQKYVGESQIVYGVSYPIVCYYFSKDHHKEHFNLMLYVPRSFKTPFILFFKDIHPEQLARNESLERRIDEQGQEKVPVLNRKCEILTGELYDLGYICSLAQIGIKQWRKLTDCEFNDENYLKFLDNRIESKGLKPHKRESFHVWNRSL